MLENNGIFVNIGWKTWFLCFNSNTVKHSKIAN